jgi:hypothetical protein
VNSETTVNTEFQKRFVFSLALLTIALKLLLGRWLVGKTDPLERKNATDTVTAPTATAGPPGCFGGILALWIPVELFAPVSDQHHGTAPPLAVIDT